jgi:fibro-slime domain-containing protein
MKYSTAGTFAIFGTIGWMASIACSASTNSTVANTGGNSNSGVGGDGTGFIHGNGGASLMSVGGSGNLNKVLQGDGTMLLLGTIRDFHSTFPDMEPCTNSPGKLCDSGHWEQNPTPSDSAQNCGGTIHPNSCFIGTTIGSDSKPVYVAPAGGSLTTTGPDNFQYWFNTQDPSLSINMDSLLSLTLTPNGDGTFTFNSDYFFPIDGQLFGNEGQADGAGTPHNYGFTTEFHLKFTYRAGQTFYFKGDDDLVVFINGQLAVDRSGIHNAQDATLNLDSLGLSDGSDYQFDLFYCERHRTLSEITITTSMEFTVPVGIN